MHSKNLFMTRRDGIPFFLNFSLFIKIIFADCFNVFCLKYSTFYALKAESIIDPRVIDAVFEY